MLQYKIPQNVGIEDRIVGPFSLRQLIMLAVGGGISYVIFVVSSRIYELNTLEYIVIVLPALFSLALAMIKIHGVSFAKFLLLTLEFAINPKKRRWDHRGISNLVSPDLSEKIKIKKRSEGVKTSLAKESVSLRKLSATLDSGGFGHVEEVRHDDIDKVKDDDLITEAYFGHKKEESSTENMYWRTRDMQKKKLSLLAKMNSEKGQGTRLKKIDPNPIDSNAATAEKIPVDKEETRKISEVDKNGKNEVEEVPRTSPKIVIKDESMNKIEHEEFSLDELKNGDGIEFNLD